MAFFLAPNGSKAPENPACAGGGNLGLSTYESFVAVEFDTFSNDWDPPYTHVGIDINRLQSVVSQRWWSNTSIMQDWPQAASIKYTAQSKNLSVVFTYWGNGNWITQELSYSVYLRDYLPEFVTFGFSASTGVSIALHTLYSWNFSSNLVPEDPSAVTHGNSGIVRLIGLAIGGLMFVLLVIGVFICCFRNWNCIRMCFCRKEKGKQPGVDVNSGLPDQVHQDTSPGTQAGVDETSGLSEICDQVHQDTAPMRFTYADLMIATNGFADDKILGKGGFGCVYQGRLDGFNLDIAVKRICNNCGEGERGYEAEVTSICKLRHKNLVRLIGWCHERREDLLLVYEYMPYGSLDNHLFNKPSLLNWGIRLQIAKDLAAVLHYLHESCGECVLHRDIKSSNVMLDADLKVRLGDFGLALLVDHEIGSYSTNPAGTIGYIAPELVSEGSKASKKADVYSFGVVVLEIDTGKRAVHDGAEQDRVSLVEWVWSMYGTRRLHEAADPGLVYNHNMEEIVWMITVGLWCANPNSNSRPSIKETARVLDGGPLPILTSSLGMLSSICNCCFNYR